MPMALHIANGMFGAVMIDPPDWLLWTRIPPRAIGVLPRCPGGAADATEWTQNPDLVVFNGYANQYRDRPIQRR